MLEYPGKYWVVVFTYRNGFEVFSQSLMKSEILWKLNCRKMVRLNQYLLSEDEWKTCFYLICKICLLVSPCWSTQMPAEHLEKKHNNVFLEQWEVKTKRIACSLPICAAAAKSDDSPFMTSPVTRGSKFISSADGSNGDAVIELH